MSIYKYLLRIPTALMKKIKKQAKKELRSVNDLIRDALEEKYD
jgi:hypothetical protein